MPDTFDVDHAFEALAHDVMGRAGPPSAVHAIKQARQRRRTTLATVAGAALVVVTGFAMPTTMGGDDSPRVAEHDGAGRVGPLPAPAEFAPDGWKPLKGSERLFPHTNSCVRSFLQPVPTGSEMQGYGLSEMARGDDRLASWFMEFEDNKQAADQLVAASASVPGCGGSTAVRHYADGDVQHFASSVDGIATDLWVARITVDGPGLIGLQNRVGLSLAVGKATASSTEVAGIADSLVASLHAPETWQGVPIYANKERLRADVSERTLEGVDTAFSAWFPRWRESDPGFALPCADLPSLGDENPYVGGWYGADAGDVRTEFHAWLTVDEATDVRAAFLSQLAACTHLIKWQVESTGPSSWLATSHVGTVWIVQDGAALGVLHARNAINPPDDVTGAVNDLLASSLVEKAAVQ